MSSKQAEQRPTPVHYRRPTAGSRYGSQPAMGSALRGFDRATVRTSLGAPGPEQPAAHRRQTLATRKSIVSGTPFFGPHLVRLLDKV
jgi:hypothetical protein